MRASLMLFYLQLYIFCDQSKPHCSENWCFQLESYFYMKMIVNVAIRELNITL